jgi:hypothetical protein
MITVDQMLLPMILNFVITVLVIRHRHYRTSQSLGQQLTTMTNTYNRQVTGQHAVDQFQFYLVSDGMIIAACDDQQVYVWEWRTKSVWNWNERMSLQVLVP